MGIVDKLKPGDGGAGAKADAAAQKLGYLIFREKTQGTPGGTEVDALVAEIASLQEQTESHTAELPEGATPSGEGAPSQDTPPPGGSDGPGDSGEGSGQTERAEK